MTLQLTDKEIKTLRRLVNDLKNPDMVPLGQLRGFITGLHSKVEQPCQEPKRARLKEARKEYYRQKLRS